MNPSDLKAHVDRAGRPAIATKAAIDGALLDNVLDRGQPLTLVELGRLLDSLGLKLTTTEPDRPGHPKYDGSCGPVCGADGLYRDIAGNVVQPST